MNSSAPLVDQLWQGLLETAMPEVRRVLSEIIRRDKATLALAFYGSMMEDMDAAQFLSVKSVEERLKPGLERMVDRADKALYAAKQAGRNTVVVASDAI